MDIDLARIAARLTEAAGRSGELKASASSTDLILSRDGFGAGRSEAVPFAALFLRDEDVLSQALDRLDAGKPGAPVSGR